MTEREKWVRLDEPRIQNPAKVSLSRAQLQLSHTHMDLDVGGKVGKAEPKGRSLGWRDRELGGSHECVECFLMSEQLRTREREALRERERERKRGERVFDRLRLRKELAIE
jgi:hypothetical protein